MKKKTMSNNQNSQYKRLLEGLEASDLARLVDRRVTVDEYKSKVGSDSEICVLTFKVQGKDPALDLVNFIEKSYDWVLDADASSGELNDGDYLVFVEADREESLVDNLITMFEDIARLTDINSEDWIISTVKPHKSELISADAIRQLVALTPEAYELKSKNKAAELDNLKLAAGIKVETRAPKNDFTESLRIAAGIR